MKKTDIAIIGMSCIFPGADDLAAFWHNIIHKVDATGPVPQDRIDPVHFLPDAPGVDRFYCNRGAFIPDFEFDPAAFGILPLAVEGTEPDHLLTISLAHKALEDAGILQRKTALDKTGIIIGKGNYAGPGATRAIEIVRTGEQIASILEDLLPHLPAEDVEKVKKEFQVRKGRFGPDTAMGLIPNLVASIVANRLNLGGAAYTVDAACASSLLAVDQAINELHSGRCNIMIAGGVHVGQNAAFWSIFTQLGALSKREKISPFDEHADGLLIGEGCGFVVLKRLEDAVKAGDKIYAVLKGIGISSDGSGTSVMSPSVNGQIKALSQAWTSAGINVQDIGYMEAHGTGTPLGDKTELETLLQFFGEGQGLPKAGLGSVKSNIGHTMPASGIAGLIKTALALYHGVIPPTLHCKEPLAKLKETRFSAIQEAVDWASTGLPRVAGVNAFGFGGINAHAVLEGYGTPKSANVKKDTVLLLARPSREALLHALEVLDPDPGEGEFRIAVFDPSPERIKKAIKIVSKNLAWRNKQDIWYTSTPLLSKGGKIAFVFPGLDGLMGGETDSVAAHFNVPQHDQDQKQGLLSEALKILNKSHTIDTALKQLGVLPDMNAGHSLGEWLAGRSSALIEEPAVLQLLNSLNPETFELKDSRFIAVGCGIEQMQPVLSAIEDLYLSNDNCPQQVILCGTNAALEKLVPILKDRQIFHQVLPFQSGFHSPFVTQHLDVILEGIQKIDFQESLFPLWSATTLALYPAGAEAIRQLSVEHLIKPVRFRELTQKLYEEGARVFIQIGSGGLTGFIDDTLRGKNISTISSNVSMRSGIAQLQRVVASLFVEGKVTALPFMGYANTATARKGIKLQLGSPLVRNLTSLKTLAQKTEARSRKKELVLENHAHPLLSSFQENIEEMMDIQEELFQLFQDRASDPSPRSPLRIPFTYQLDISLENCPYLTDHALLRQPKGWDCIEDTDPVIPMTMIFELFGEIAAAQSSGAHQERVQKIMNIKVFQWMKVARPFRETVTGTWKNDQIAVLNLEGFASAEVLLYSGYAEEPVPGDFDLGKLLNIDRTREQIYEAHLFHGPAYQGIKKIVAVGDRGIFGTIEGGTGKGSLLDNAGQLFGLWLQLTLTKDRIAFPVKIQEIEFFGDLEDQAGVFECTCVLTELTDEFATANILLKRADKVWARITGWQNRRLEIDDRLWNVSIAPLENGLSEEIAPGIFFFHQAYNRVVSWDFILKRYFNQQEKQYHQTLFPNRKKEWLISRVAVKDAVRALLTREKQSPCFPIEFEVRSDEVKKPYVYGPLTEGIHISIAHKGTDAVGIARLNRAAGIDIEQIEERNQGFYDLAFSETELALLNGRDKNEWGTRFWVAKEAYGKSLGKGLQGNPKRYTITEINGEDLKINDIFITTIKHQNYIIGWTH